MATGRRRASVPRSNRVLSPTGRKGPVPECPVELGSTGERWWSWAWSTPQATAWTSGVTWTVALRAQVADRLENGDLSERDRASWMLRAQALDKDLGLSPAGMKSLGWSIGSAVETAAENSEMEVVQLDDFRSGLVG